MLSLNSLIHDVCCIFCLKVIFTVDDFFVWPWIMPIRDFVLNDRWHSSLFVQLLILLGLGRLIDTYIVAYMSSADSFLMLVEKVFATHHQVSYKCNPLLHLSFFFAGHCYICLTFMYQGHLCFVSGTQYHVHSNIYRYETLQKYIKGCIRTCQTWCIFWYL